jgi:hypothetical protein
MKNVQANLRKINFDFIQIPFKKFLKIFSLKQKGKTNLYLDSTMKFFYGFFLYYIPASNTINYFTKSEIEKESVNFTKYISILMLVVNFIIMSGLIVKELIK